MKQITLSTLGLFLFVFSITLQAETPATWKLGTGLSILDYKQTGFAFTTQTWMHFKGEGSYSLSENWSMDGKVGLGLLPLNKTGTSFNLRHLEMSAAASYNAFRVFDERPCGECLRRKRRPRLRRLRRPQGWYAKDSFGD